MSIESAYSFINSNIQSLRSRKSKFPYYERAKETLTSAVSNHEKEIIERGSVLNWFKIRFDLIVFE